MINEKIIIKFSKLFKIIIIKLRFTVIMLMMQVGNNIGWSSPNIARLNSNKSRISLTRDEVSWVASSVNIGGALGAVFGLLSIKFFGTKPTGLIAFALFSSKWICLLIANNFILLVIARFIGGLGMVITFSSTLIFLGEISKPETRGTMISIVITGGVVGKLFASYLETYFFSNVTSPIYLSQCIVGITLLMFVLPESPYFLMKSGNLVKTRQSIATYFPNENIEEKLGAIKIFLENQATFTSTTIVENKTETKSKSMVKLLLFIVIFSSLVEGSGFTTVVAYMEVILIRGKSCIIEPKKVAIIDSFLSLVLRLMTCKVVDKIGRKILLITASVVIGVTFTCLGIYFCLLNYNFDLNNFQWVPVVCLLTFKASFTIGFFTSLQTLLSEFFPVNVKNLANCLAQLTSSLIGFLLSSTFLWFSDSIGEQYIFWIHGLFGLLVTPFVIFFLPETKGKKLEDI